MQLLKQHLRQFFQTEILKSFGRKKSRSMKRFFVIPVVLFLCCQGNSPQPATDVENVSETEDTIVHEDSHPILLKNEMSHLFSSSETSDEFKLELIGETILSSIAILTISNEEYGEIYHEEFAAEDLIGWGMDDSTDQSDAAKELYIFKRVNEFFDEKNFPNPAINAKEEFDSNYGIKEYWQDIKDDKAIGFHYYIGKEDGRWIAFSRKLKKVVLYFNCC